ncbi:hypothetical protein HPB50_019397 [Hyalomma asiaticum]|uniref:Uncharacterized protein n=1 Tax=Hyalomma asiaticum TaxID=266040 RepID=A0ACB7SJB0_HYAAI|nr:hypothetical protein HPB50_019397 [Hyalomma asiaticum]
MGMDFTVQKALRVAREEERVDRALQQLSGAHVNSVSSRRVQNGVSARRPLNANGQHGGLPPPPVLPPLLLVGLLPPRLRHHRLVWVRASAAARRSTGLTPAPALLGAALVRGAGSADTSAKSAGRPAISQLQVLDRRR